MKKKINCTKTNVLKKLLSLRIGFLFRVNNDFKKYFIILYYIEFILKQLTWRHIIYL
jgi:hypothetical protein